MGVAVLDVLSKITQGACILQYGVLVWHAVDARSDVRQGLQRERHESMQNHRQSAVRNRAISSLSPCSLFVQADTVLPGCKRWQGWDREPGVGVRKRPCRMGR